MTTTLGATTTDGVKPAQAGYKAGVPSSYYLRHGPGYHPYPRQPLSSQWDLCAPTPSFSLHLASLGQAPSLGPAFSEAALAR